MNELKESCLEWLKHIAEELERMEDLCEEGIDCYGSCIIEILDYRSFQMRNIENVAEIIGEELQTFHEFSKGKEVGFVKFGVAFYSYIPKEVQDAEAIN